jgi:hypothetical protein
VTDGPVTTTATLAALARRRARPPLTLTALGDCGDREEGNEPGEHGESSHGRLQESRHACAPEGIAASTITSVQFETRAQKDNAAHSDSV